jgi:pilus assembly protein CpaB
MNPRQRRGAVLLILAAIGAIVVFVSVVGYVGSVRAEVRDKISVLQLTKPVAAYATVDESAVKRVEVTANGMPRDALLTDIQDLTGKVAATDVPEGALLEKGMFVNAPTLQPGQREIAIMIDAETGVAGKVQPGMLVDIYASFQQQNGTAQKSCAVRVISNARVINVGQLRKQADGQNPNDVTQVVPVTFALSVADSLKLTYAESFAAKVRLALIGGQGELTAVKRMAPVCTTPIAR